MSSGVGRRRGWDLALLWLWLWHRLADIAPIGPLAGEPPYAVGAALEKDKTKQNKTKTLHSHLIYFTQNTYVTEVGMC